MLEENAVKSSAQPVPSETQPAAEEKSPLDSFLDEFDALKNRVAQLEAAIQTHSHNIDGTGLNSIAQHVEQYLFAKFRGRKPPVG